MRARPIAPLADAKHHRNPAFSMCPAKATAAPLNPITVSYDRMTTARAEMPYIQLLLEGHSSKKCYFIFFI
jgi:hypothetical protein